MDCFEQVQRKGMLFGKVTYTCILKARTIDRGKEVHYEILSQGLLEDHNVLGGALMDM